MVQSAFMKVNSSQHMDLNAQGVKSGQPLREMSTFGGRHTTIGSLNIEVVVTWRGGKKGGNLMHRVANRILSTNLLVEIWKWEEMKEWKEWSVSQGFKAIYSWNICIQKLKQICVHYRYLSKYVDNTGIVTTW